MGLERSLENQTINCPRVKFLNIIKISLRKETFMLRIILCGAAFLVASNVQAQAIIQIKGGGDPIQIPANLVPPKAAIDEFTGAISKVNVEKGTFEVRSEPKVESDNGTIKMMKTGGQRSY